MCCRKWEGDAFLHENRKCFRLLGTTVLSASLSYLHPCLAELGPLRQLLPGVHVRVLRPLECPLQLLDLLGSERRAAAALLPLQRDARLALHVAVVV